MTSPLTELIAETLRLDEKATEGPWVAYEKNPYSIAREFEILHNMGTLFRSTSYGRMQEDSQCIAAYRSSAPRLARICERLLSAVEFYADEDDWALFFSGGNIFDEQDGDPVMAFGKGEDSPWSSAKQALEDCRKIAEGK